MYRSACLFCFGLMLTNGPALSVADEPVTLRRFEYRALSQSFSCSMHLVRRTGAAAPYEKLRTSLGKVLHSPTFEVFDSLFRNRPWDEEPFVWTVTGSGVPLLLTSALQRVRFRWAVEEADRAENTEAGSGALITLETIAAYKRRWRTQVKRFARSFHLDTELSVIENDFAFRAPFEKRIQGEFDSELGGGVVYALTYGRLADAKRTPFLILGRRLHRRIDN